MTTVFDVPPQLLIPKLAAKLKEEPSIAQPAWAAFAKTGVHREESPYDRTWWHTRVAAVLRKVYSRGPIGVAHLAAEYGGSRDRGAAPKRAKAGSGSIAREALQQLEASGLVEPVKGKGRRVTAKGRKLCDAAAREAREAAVLATPALAKY